MIRPEEMRVNIKYNIFAPHGDTREVIVMKVINVDGQTLYLLDEPMIKGGKDTFSEEEFIRVFNSGKIFIYE